MITIYKITRSNCGLENFTIEIIEKCEMQEQANKRERFWINV